MQKIKSQHFIMLLSVFASNWETGDHDGVKSNRECSNSIERWALDSISMYPRTHHHGAALFEYQLTSGIQAV